MASKAKWQWVVVFMDGTKIDVPVARGAKDARLQAMWMVRDRTGAFPAVPVVEVRKLPTGGSPFVYVSRRSR